MIEKIITILGIAAAVIFTAGLLLPDCDRERRDAINAERRKEKARLRTAAERRKAGETS